KMNGPGMEPPRLGSLRVAGPEFHDPITIGDGQRSCSDGRASWPPPTSRSPPPPCPPTGYSDVGPFGVWVHVLAGRWGINVLIRGDTRRREHLLDGTSTRSVRQPWRLSHYCATARRPEGVAWLVRMCQGVAVAEGSERDAVLERWNAAGAGWGMWMDMALDPRVATWTAPEGERATLLEYLRRYRLTMEMKCADLDAAQLASRSVPPSTMSLLGLIRHMADVERHWFRRVMAQSGAPPLYWSEDVPDAEWLGAVADPALVDDAWRAWRG